MKTIAVIEDDIYIGNVLEELLTESGYSVIRAYSGTEGLLLLEKSKPDLVLLDLMLPGISGEEVLQNISELAPVMILSAKTEVSGKVKNLNAGAVDYITKPFDNDELLARVGVALRRREAHADGVVSRAGIVMDTDTYSVTVEEKSPKLTKTEFAILKMFLLNPKKVFSKSAILDYISDYTPDGEESSVSVHISNLRNKLKEASDRNYIRTVWGIGFQFDGEHL